ncbi:MAG: SDR family NAD(P)-dependent oxidoreductase [Candidatus Competibacteraceae bacterium]
MIPAQSILITGCSSGIGLHLASGLQTRGHRVFATARKPEDVERLRAQGLESLQLDLTDSISIQNAVATVLELTHGSLNALLNNAAYGQPGAVEDLRRDVLREQFETNLFGTLELTNLIIPVMRRQGHGRIIQISSILGLVAMPYRGAYSASKFALESLSDTLRLELMGTNIQVALIEPGPIVSHFRENAYAAYRRNIDKEKSPHRTKYEAMEKRLLRQGPVLPFTLPPNAVLKQAIHAIESSKPKIRYYVTVPTYLMAALRRVLPYRAVDWLLQRIPG